MKNTNLNGFIWRNLAANHGIDAYVHFDQALQDCF